MGNWLTVGVLAVVALLWLLWREIGSTEARPTPAPAVQRLASPGVDGATPPAAKLVVPAEEAAGPAAAVAETRPAKLDPRSDEFFYRVDEAIPKTLTRNAARCYEGRHGQLHRNQKLSLTFKVKIVDGEVRVRDVAVKESTLHDTALETCFLQEVQRSTWKNDELPDWEQEEELVLRPERGMKKYWQDNLNDVGPQAPRQ